MVERLIRIRGGMDKDRQVKRESMYNSGLLVNMGGRGWIWIAWIKDSVDDELYLGVYTSSKG